jgi:SAM-dependent methyltransferase
MKALSDETKTLKDYWESLSPQWESPTYEKAVSYRAYAARLIQRTEGVNTSLEIGFGDGKWMKLLRKRGIDTYGIDILENSASTLKKEGFLPVVADARTLPFKEDSFDLTYSFGVVEHFEDTEKAIEEHIRVTRPGKKIIITVPYLFSPLTLYWMFLHIKRGTFKKRPASFGKRYTRQGFKEILEKVAVKDISVDPFLFSIPKVRKIYLENPLSNRVGLMLWAEMTKV